MKKIKPIIALALASLFLTTSCSNKEVSNPNQKETIKYEDGTYRGKSSTYGQEDDLDSGYAIVTFSVADGKITECELKTYELDGTLKGEEYYTNANLDTNQKRNAKTAVEACVEYANMLITSQSIDDVDCISGATLNYNQFVDAVNKALKSGPINTK